MTEDKRIKKWKRIAIALAVVLIASNLYFIYKSIDFGITHTYMMASYEENQDSLQLLQVIVNKTVFPMDKDQFISILKKARPGIDIFIKDNNVVAGYLGFKINGNKVIAIDNANSNYIDNELKSRD
jgi:hypothetical protein